VVRVHVTWLAAALFAVTVALEIAAVALSWGLEPHYDTVVYVVFSGAMVGAGALIASRHPSNPIGWLLCATGLLNALGGDFAQGYGLRAAAAGWPGGPPAEWIATSSWLPQGIPLVLTFLLFPDGRLLGRRWAAIAALAAVGVALAAPGWSLDPASGSEFVAGVNPYAIDGLPTAAMFGTGMTLVAASLAASVLALVVRFRRSSGVQRQQVKWVLLAWAVAAAILPLTVVLWERAPVVQVLVALALAALPISICIAIRRYRLYDIDVVINRTLVYVTLTILLGALYAASVVLLGIGGGRGSVWATAGATLAVAVAFRPLRARVQDAVDRRFDRARYDALRRVATFLDDLRAGRASPEEVEAVLRGELRDDGLELRFFLPDIGRYVDSRGRPVADDPADGRERFPITRGGALLGVVVCGAGSEPRHALVARVVDAAGLGIEIARLRVELRRQLDEVQASRARIVAVADEERRRIERNLHDGAQQRLVSIGLALRHAQHALGPAVAPEAGRALDGAVAEIAVTIDELRELAHGLRPSTLDAGLGAALRDLAQRAPLAVEVSATAERFGPDTETAAYFVACEGLTNAVKHAGATTVTLSAARDNGALVVSVSDDGIGGAHPQDGSGLTGLADRVAAQGGTLTIDTGRGGTTLRAELPCGS
jgi:signal transduction histidine kinase